MSYPAAEVKIDEPGQYLTRGGETVTVSSRRQNAALGIPGSWWDGSHPNGVPESWHRSGRIFSSMESPHDIVSKKGAGG